MRATAELLRAIGYVAIGAVACAQDTTPRGPRDLTQASLEDLMNLQVTSVSKKEEKLWTAGAAIFVITQEDIRRSGATNIPDALRMAPGVNVARANASTWAISIRGINDIYGNKILLLIDGRAVYNPLFSGVYWDEIDVPLEDIERIEVIRGPGGTLWGNNAMNGVINIITMSSAQTQGGVGVTTGGSDAPASVLAQFGGKIGESGTYRVFEKYFNIDSFQTPAGAGALDGWHSLHEGFRADWKFLNSGSLMIEGDVQRVAFGQSFTGEGLSGIAPIQETVSGVNHTTSANLMARWTKETRRGDEITVQAYENHEDRTDLGQVIVEDTGDVEFQDHMAVGNRQDVVWGIGSRINAIRTAPGAALAYYPADHTDFLSSAFVQDQIRLSDTLSLTLGSKFEHNSYTGFEYQPSANLIWTPSIRQTIWLSAGRALHEPNMTDTSLRAVASVFPVPGLAYGMAVLTDTNAPRVETVNDFEAGYRAELARHFSLDLAAYANFYRDLRLGEKLPPSIVFAPSYAFLSAPLTYAYDNRANTHGGEIFVNWDVSPRWRLSPGYSLYRQAWHAHENLVPLVPGESGLTGPRESFELRSQLTLAHHLEWDTTFAYTSSIMAGAIPAYARLDSRISWQTKRYEISINGQNLLRPWHAEYPDELNISHALIPRSVFARVLWRF